MSRPRAWQYLVFLSILASPATPQGIIATIAGGSSIFRGDGGPATAAALGGVFATAIDSAGNLYAADRDNELVVKITPDGVLTVLVGNGFAGSAGDGGR